ncbi:hypothetical protein Cst_c25230 [Thermoclostridium stercorarium subsp. stercorarium DSM 8532]|uniref:Uncharacterized protein n=1 Tax=Thermoclostridium stercorarium (strain ATCC 35414 / DSM 8532 / NCIMB 11754) TaxID=1121335 RepID=L7VMN1_THES1|nr:hypothetical protein Cst_c25230 [Thermoclostridium stercorarium subsp. stercorarium DSM 8532]
MSFYFIPENNGRQHVKNINIYYVRTGLFLFLLKKRFFALLRGVHS